MLRFFSLPAALFICGLIVGPQPASAVTPAKELLPTCTKGYLSIPDMEKLIDGWNKTMLGELSQEPVMEPFINDLERQIDEWLAEGGVKLGVTVDDVRDLAGGEVCLAMLQPGGKPTAYAAVLIVDVTGHEEELNTVLAKIDKNQLAKGAKKSTHPRGGVEVVLYAQPVKPDQTKPSMASYCLRQNQLIASDDPNVLVEILTRTAGAKTDLASVVAFKEVITRCTERSGNVVPHLSWFVEPFGFIETLRASQGGRKKRGTDLLKVLKNQGFDAIQGVGGVATLAVTDELDALHRTLIYAPPVWRKTQLAARMLEFGDPHDLTPQAWVPREVSSYLSYTWEMQPAFYFSKTLVDEMADAPVFDDVFDGILTDLAGPRVDIRGDVVAHVGNRATMLSDFTTPITPESQRSALVLPLNDPDALIKREFAARDVNRDGRITEEEEPEERRPCFRKLLKKHRLPKDSGLTLEQYIQLRSIDTTLRMAFEDDPMAEKTPVGNQLIWEMLDENNDTWAVAFVHGHLFASQNKELVIKLLPKPAATLQNSADYKTVSAALKKLGAGNDNLRYFTRSDESSRVDYEMLRTGKMPESQTLFGRLLNRIFGPKEEDEKREQRLDASKLPEYQIVRRYLGPAGVFANTEKTGDGWYAVGVLLPK